MAADDLRNGWRRQPLLEAFAATRKPRGLKYDEVPAIPFIPMAMVPEGRTYFSEFIPKTAAELTSGTYFEAGDVLIPKITPSFENGKQGIPRDLPTPFGLATTEVIPLHGIEGRGCTEFLFYYLLNGSVRNLLASRMEGSTGRQRLPKDVLLGHVMPVPPLPEQRAIAAALSAVRTAAAARRREADAERERKLYAMHDLFDAAATLAERGVSSHRTVTLDDETLFSFENGLWKGKRDPMTDCAVVRNTNFGPDGRIDFSDVAVIPVEARHIERKRLRPGDIVIERSGGGPKQPVGRVVMFEGDGTFCFSNFTSRLRVEDRDRVEPDYLLFWLLDFHLSGQTRRLQRRTTGIRNLAFHDYRQIAVPLPPVERQRQITAALRAMEAVELSLTHAADLHDELFHALLEELMGGRLSAAALIPHTDRPG